MRKDPMDAEADKAGNISHVADMPAATAAPKPRRFLSKVGAGGMGKHRPYCHRSSGSTRQIGLGCRHGSIPEQGCHLGILLLGSHNHDRGQGSLMVVVVCSRMGYGPELKMWVILGVES